MMFKNRQTCPRCGKKASTDARFCPQCGTALGGGNVRCGNCGVENRSDARFCKNCGREINRSVAASVHRHRWARTEGDFAVRINAEDLPGLLKSGLIIEPGTNALLVDKGTVVATVAPGEYTLDSMGNRLKEWFTGRIPESVTALLVDVTPTELEFHLGGIFTKDPLRIGASVRLQAQVSQPGKFLVNMLKGDNRLSKEDLRQFLYPEVVQVIDRWVRQYTVQELDEDPELKARLELALEESLEQTFSQLGLAFLNLRVFELNLEHIDRIRGTRSKYALQVSEAEVEAEGRKRLLDAQQDLDLVKLAEETRKVEQEERRVELYERMRQAVMSNRMKEITSQAEFEEFLNDIDHDKLLREKEREELLRTWREEAEDHEKARDHLLAKLEIERDYELRAAELKLRSDLNEKELEAELRLERLRASKQFEIEAARQEYELRRRRAQLSFEEELAESRRRQDDLEAKARIARQHDAHNEQTRQLEENMTIGLKGLRGIKQVRAEAERAKWELEKERLELEWARQKQQLELEMQRERIQMEHELNRMDKLGQLGAEALIALSGPEQARILADLKKTETLKGMSEEQILAAAAAESPEVAKAFQEKFRAIAEGKASERDREMYERLLAEKEARERATVEAWDKASARAKETAERALDRMADTAKAFANGKGNAPIVITGTGTGGPQVISSAGGQSSQASREQKVCPKCGKFVDADARHCEHCGQKFEGV